MPININTQAITAFKHLLGKSNTDVNKGVNNEFEGIGLTITGENVWIEIIDATPEISVGAGVVVAVSCTTILDATSNGHALFALWPAVPPIGTDPKTGLAFTYGTGSLVNITAGDRVRRAVPDSFGLAYLAKPFFTGSPIPVGDQRDWVYQYNSGIFYQEDGSNEGWGGSPYGHPDRIDLYVYIGDTVLDITGGGNSEWYASVTSIECNPPGSPNTGDRYLICPGPSPAATGAWVGLEDKIAEWSGVAWLYTEPTQGGTVQIDDQPGVYYLYTGADYPGGEWIRVPSTIVRIGSATGIDTYLATVAPPIVDYTNVVFIGVFDNANTGASTININSLGTVLVRKRENGSLVDLDANDIRPGIMYMLVHDGTIFQLYTGDLGDFIPLTGTKPDQPITGDLEVIPGVTIFTRTYFNPRANIFSDSGIEFNTDHIKVVGGVAKYDSDRIAEFDINALVTKGYVDLVGIKHTLITDRVINENDMYTVFGDFTLNIGQTLNNDGRLVIINGSFLNLGTYNESPSGSLEIVRTNLDYILGFDNKVNGQDILWTDGTGNWVTGQSTTYFNTAVDNAFITKEYVDANISSFNGIYTGSGSLSGNTQVTQDVNILTFKALTATYDSYATFQDSGITIQSQLLSNSQKSGLRLVPSMGSLGWRDPVNNNLSTFEAYEQRITMRSDIADYKQEIDFSLTDMLVTDTVNSKGLYYAADYATGATDRWIVDKKYVDARTAKSVVTFTPGTVGVANTISHNRGTADIMVQLWDVTTGAVITADTIDNVTTTDVDITFTGSNPAGDVKAIII